MKTLITMLLVSFTLTAQQVNPSLTRINTTLSDSFAVLGEKVEDLFIDPEIEGRLIATTGSDEPKIKISTDYGGNWAPATMNSLESSEPYVRPNEISFNTSNYNIGYVAVGIDL